MAKSKYDPKTFPFKVEHYKKQKLSDKQVAYNLGISQDTFYTYLKKYPEFSEGYKRGKLEIIEQLENAMYRRALGYEFDEVTTEIKTDQEGNVIFKHMKKIKKHYAPDPTSNIFLLTNLNNEKYKRNPDPDTSTDETKEIVGLRFEEVKGHDDE